MRSMVEGVRRASVLKVCPRISPETGAAGLAPPPPRYTRSPSPYGGGSFFRLASGWLASITLRNRPWATWV
jgi:hypothetical protein